MAVITPPLTTGFEVIVAEDEVTVLRVAVEEVA